MPYIKVLYEGINLKALPLAFNNVLYRGSSLSNNEIIKIKKYLNDKIKGLPGAILFSKTFLSFSKEANKAEKFLSREKNTNNLSKVLFVVEKENNLDYDLSTHADIENFSYHPNEKEVLFFPFSSFEIKDIKEIINKNEKIYGIKLLYLGKYLKEIQKDNILIINDENIPDSKFKKLFIQSGLIKEEKINKITIKQILIKYEKYKT